MIADLINDQLPRMAKSTKGKTKWREYGIVSNEYKKLLVQAKLIS